MYLGSLDADKVRIIRLPRAVIAVQDIVDEPQLCHMKLFCVLVSSCLLEDLAEDLVNQLRAEEHGSLDACLRTKLY